MKDLINIEVDICICMPPIHFVKSSLNKLILLKNNKRKLNCIPDNHKGTCLTIPWPFVHTLFLDQSSILPLDLPSNIKRRYSCRKLC